MQLFTASLQQSRGSAGDKSTEAAFVLVVCKMDSESGGECGVNVKPSHFSFFLAEFICAIICVTLPCRYFLSVLLTRH